MATANTTDEQQAATERFPTEEERLANGFMKFGDRLRSEPEDDRFELEARAMLRDSRDLTRLVLTGRGSIEFWDRKRTRDGDYLEGNSNDRFNRYVIAPEPSSVTKKQAQQGGYTLIFSALTWNNTHIAGERLTEGGKAQLVLRDNDDHTVSVPISSGNIGLEQIGRQSFLYLNPMYGHISLVFEGGGGGPRREFILESLRPQPTDINESFVPGTVFRCRERPLEYWGMSLKRKQWLTGPAWERNGRLPLQWANSCDELERVPTGDPIR